MHLWSGFSQLIYPFWLKSSVNVGFHGVSGDAGAHTLSRRRWVYPFCVLLAWCRIFVIFEGCIPFCLTQPALLRAGWGARAEFPWKRDRTVSNCKLHQPQKTHSFLLCFPKSSTYHQLLSYCSKPYSKASKKIHFMLRIPIWFMQKSGKLAFEGICGA